MKGMERLQMLSDLGLDQETRILSTAQALCFSVWTDSPISV